MMHIIKTHLWTYIISDFNEQLYLKHCINPFDWGGTCTIDFPYIYRHKNAKGIVICSLFHLL